MLQVVFVQVAVHRDAFGPHRLVVLGARQRRQDIEFQQIDRQLALDDLDVAPDRFRRLAGKAENVARIEKDALFLPGQHHLAVLGDLVLLLLGGGEIVGIDVLEAEEDARDAGFFRLLDETRNLVAHGVDLDHQAERDFVHLAQLGKAVEDRLPFPVACEVVVGDEEARDVLLPIVADDLFDVVGRTEARLAALHVDDRAERALERTAAAGIEGRVGAGGAPHELPRQKRARRSAEAGQIVHVVVERLQLAGGGVAQQAVEASLGFAGEQRDAHGAGGIEVDRGAVEHGQAAGYMEAAHRHRNAGVAKRLGDVEGARILVRLHADQPEQAEIAMLAEAPDQLLDVDAGIGLVDDVDVDFDVLSQDMPLRRIERQAVNGGERIRRNQGPPPTDDVAVIVVMRGF